MGLLFILLILLNYITLYNKPCLIWKLPLFDRHPAICNYSLLIAFDVYSRWFFSKLSPTVFQTIFLGLVMAPATVLVYIQLSHFLMTLMTFSWLYATFFFLSLCSAIGPTNNFCQLSIGSLLSCFKQKDTEERVGAGDNAGFENHEMAKIST